jgi:hypothetical protein
MQARGEVGFHKIQAKQEKVLVSKKLNNTEGVVKIMCKMKVVTSSSYRNTMQQLKHHIELL